MESRLLMIEAEESFEVLNALASKTRLQILKLLNGRKLNVNEIAEELHLPQSTISTNITVLEKSGLITVESAAGKKGSQKLCSIPYDEVVVTLPGIKKEVEQNIIEVAMPVGLYTDFEVNPPCGLCSTEGIIGFLDVPETFFNPKRAVASLVWFARGFIEYKFPNNLPANVDLKWLEISLELCSEALIATPETTREWPSDITMWLNGVEIGTWTSPGDFGGDVRGKFTPMWWKSAGSQYGLLKNWKVSEEGSFIDGTEISNVTLADLDIRAHTSVKVRIGIKKNAANIGGVNIFGRGFGNYDQDIVMRMYVQ
jgi:predicted transcriptional regulator